MRFIKGDYITEISYIIMGFGCMARHQIVKGLLYLVVQVAYIYYIIQTGAYYLVMFKTLGIQAQGEVWNEELQIYQAVKGDNSMILLLFGVVTICLTVGIFILYIMNTKTAYKNECLIKDGKHVSSFKEEWKKIWDSKYHITVLYMLVVLTFLFTVLPLIFMILMAFTNFDKNHQPPGNLFTWVGFENFQKVLYQNPMWQTTFTRLLIWTFV